MGPWISELDRLLTANESKAARERLMLIQLFEELRVWAWRPARWNLADAANATTSYMRRAGDHMRCSVSLRRWASYPTTFDRLDHAALSDFGLIVPPDHHKDVRVLNVL